MDLLPTQHEEAHYPLSTDTKRKKQSQVSLLRARIARGAGEAFYCFVAISLFGVIESIGCHKAKMEVIEALTLLQQDGQFTSWAVILKALQKLIVVSG